jgi:hypothetical protein
MVNAEFELAEQFALHTRKHCFITGRAGTGKTTLLKRLVERTHKNVVLVAPTGVAAVNAGGTTIHSMFGLPLTCFVPGDDIVDLNVATNRKLLLGERLRLTRERVQVLREMDLLVIDEASMVRADVLDAIDLILRHVRGKRQAFGDAQVLIIGDVHQLPPVVKDAEWDILKAYYRSPFFFDSRSWTQLNAAQIELQKMDMGNIVATMRYLEQLGLQILMASPGENLGTLTANLHRYYDILRDPDNNTIMIEGHDVTQQTRDLFQADLPEFNPDLVAQEIALLQAVPMAPAS